MSEVNEVIEQEVVNEDNNNPFTNADVVDASQQSETYQVDWEAEAKKFQSMHDKQASENDGIITTENITASNQQISSIFVINPGDDNIDFITENNENVRSNAIHFDRIKGEENSFVEC